MRSILPIVALVVALGPLTAFGSSVGPPSDALEQAVLAELNLVRLEHGLRLLQINPRLTAAAHAHSREMVQSGYFGHESADGRSFAARIKRFYRPRSRPWAVGEVLIWQPRRLTARAAVSAWLASPGHRENLLERAFREVGIAAVRSLAAPGVYGKQPVTVLTVDFGAR